MDALKSRCAIEGASLFLAEGKRVSSSSRLLKAKGSLSTSWIPGFQAPPSRLALARCIYIDRPKPAWPAAAAPKAAENVTEADNQTEFQPRTVRVRVVLEKECLFGEQFLLVGEGPKFGLWNPSDAVPMEWSVGHAWTAELDLPVGESVQFKFILRGSSGETIWQPGPDRNLKIWETTNTIVVTEDWESTENQKITEEPLEDLATTKSMIGSNGAPLVTLTEELATMESMIGNNDEPLVALTNELAIMESLNGNNGISITEEATMGVITRNQESIAQELMLHSTKGEELGSYEDLVLIPALTPAATPVAASFFPNEVVNAKMGDASFTNHETESYIASQVSEDTVESGIQTSCQTKTVHAKFVLEKACLFSQRLLIVGDDQLFGSWDPLDAVPFECSDGQVWTAELDLPVGKSIHFKFMLRSTSGEIEWQPGPRRILRVPNTAKAIVISEDWDNADNQNIVEEPLANLIEDVVTTESMIDINDGPVIDDITMGVRTARQVSTEDVRISQSTRDEELSSYVDKRLLVAGLTSVRVPVTTSVFPDEIINGKINGAFLANEEAENCNTSQVNEDTVQSDIQTSCQTKTVHARFILEKACLFGQQLLIVGDGPLLGSWDPLHAVLCEWSDGQVWTTQLDLPVGKSIRFKFILRSTSGEIVWQPGPDRILRVPNTAKAIVISEDWDNAHNQNIVQEPLANLTEDVVTTESMTDINGRRVIDDTVMGVTTTRQVSMKDETIIDGEMVGASLANDEAENCNTSQLSGEQADSYEVEEEAATLVETACMGDDSEEKHYLQVHRSQPTTSVLGNVTIWGREMLHRLLISLGLK